MFYRFLLVKNRKLLWKLLIFSICRGNGYISDYPTGRLLRDAKLYEIGAGTSEVRRLVIGRALNKEYA
jgi:isovaleryl-CoA dehydrogenase